MDLKMAINLKSASTLWHFYCSPINVFELWLSGYPWCSLQDFVKKISNPFFYLHVEMSLLRTEMQIQNTILYITSPINKTFDAIWFGIGWKQLLGTVRRFSIPPVKGQDDVEQDPEKNPVKGVLDTKTYRLIKKLDSNRTFKCSFCNVVKSSIHNLNAHHRQRHQPQMCGICGRTFTLLVSLTRHMYDHNEKRYNCEKCEQSFHFESELESHKIVHKSNPSYQCMNKNCGKCFMRKWDLTLHLQKNGGKKHNCDYENCTFSTDTDKQLKEHYKSHSDDCTHKCKLCDTSFR